jgi:ketosteroid isomerase-like protein
MSRQDAVRKASKKFYAGLNLMAEGRRRAFEDIWAHGPAVTAMHPIGGRVEGWEAVRDSFDQVAGSASGGKIELRDQLIQVVGDMAYEVGVERGEFTMAGDRIEIEQRVTNVYRRQGDEWKMVHHHTDTSQAMIDVLNRLQASQAPGRG